MIEATKETPAPLDAYETAKDGEPIWVAQGGHPLSAPLLRVWSIFARIMAGVIPDQGTEIVYAEMLRAAQMNRPDTNAEREGLLIRATQTEEISWAMDDYRNGLAVEEREEIIIAVEFDRLDLFDLRRRCATFMSMFWSEMNEYRLELIRREYMVEGDYIDHQIRRVIDDLKYIHSTIEIRRQG